MPSALEYLQQEYENLNSDWRSNMDERRSMIEQVMNYMQNSGAGKINPNYAGMMGALGGYMQPGGGAAQGFYANKMLQHKINDTAQTGGMDLMNEFLGDSGKQLSDLQRAVLNRLSAKETAARDFMPQAKVIDGSLVEYDPNTRTTRVLYENIRNSPLYEKIWNQIFDASLKDNMGFENDAARRQYVTEQADKTFATAKSHDVSRIGSPVPDETEQAFEQTPIELPTRPMTNAGASVQPEAVPSKPFEAQKAGWSHTVGPDQAKAVEQYIAKRMQEGVPEEQIKKEVSAKFAPQLASDATAQTPTTVTPKLFNAQTQAQRTQTGKNQAEEIDADRKSLSEIRNMNNSIQILKGALNEKSTTYGPAHELVSKVGGFLSYIDPDTKLAQMAGNDAAYFGKMMELTREKIQALGAGTAVSNLDLIVTQKSVGDLRNTREGNKKLFAIMELHNAMLADKLEQKMNYFTSSDNPDLNKFKATDDMTHIIRRKGKADGTGEYYVQSKEDWIAEQVKRGHKPEDAERDFDEQSYTAVRNLFKIR